MDFRFLFTTFDGRIGRKQFWMGIIVLIIASFALIVVVGLLLGTFIPITILSLICSLIMLYPALALSLKRLFDRNKAINPWAYIFFGPGILINIMQRLGIGFTSAEVGDIMDPFPTNGLTIALSGITAIIGIWALVELGFLKGTTGDNEFGPDPVPNSVKALE